MTTPERLSLIKSALSAAVPPGWRTRLTTRGRFVVLTIVSAPVDLLAVHRAAYPGNDRPFVKVCPTAFEDPWDDASAAIGSIWRALHAGNTVEFDAAGDRAGDLPFVELWIGSAGKPFVVTAA